MDSTTAEELKEKMTSEEEKARQRLTSSFQDLQKASQGTSAALTLSVDILSIQLDTLVVMLVKEKLLDKASFWNAISDRMDERASECRQALIAQGASMLPGQKPS